ncbi:hypothetical protein MMC16_004989 [Acarospora aff. strigata]|nr:hypothetical protein [Acarospora aff. strigata]
MPIVANEIEGLDDPDGGTGMLTRYFAPSKSPSQTRSNTEGSEGSGNGGRGGGIWTSSDKAHVVRGMIEENTRTQTEAGETETETGPDIRTVTVYVGDSPTDLECLTLVDVGICIRDEPLQSGQAALKEVLERVGVRCLWMGEMGALELDSGDGHEDGHATNGKGGGLWWARDFDEICDSPWFRSLSEGSRNG